MNAPRWFESLSLRQIQDKPATAGFVVSGAEERASCFVRVGDSKSAPLREIAPADRGRRR
jgi:hypothetical protein